MNDRVVLELGKKVNPSSDVISVDGNLVSVRPKQELKWVLLYKPKGAMTTTVSELWAHSKKIVFVCQEYFLF